MTIVCLHPHSVHWGLNPPLNNITPLFLAKPPLKSVNSPSPPFLGNLPPLYWFFVNPIPKNINKGIQRTEFHELVVVYLIMLK